MKSVEEEAIEIYSDFLYMLPMALQKLAKVQAEYCVLRIKHSHDENSEQHKHYQAVQDKIKSL